MSHDGTDEDEHAPEAERVVYPALVLTAQQRHHLDLWRAAESPHHLYWHWPQTADFSAEPLNRDVWDRLAADTFAVAGAVVRCLHDTVSDMVSDNVFSDPFGAGSETSPRDASVNTLARWGVKLEKLARSATELETQQFSAFHIHRMDHLDPVGVYLRAIPERLDGVRVASRETLLALDSFVCRVFHDAFVTFADVTIKASGDFSRSQAAAIRDVFPAPPGGRPEWAAEYGADPVLSPHCLTDTVAALAREIHATQDFSQLPILADAMEEAGCDHQPALAHLRGDERHYRGCWAWRYVLRGFLASDAGSRHENFAKAVRHELRGVI